MEIEQLAGLLTPDGAAVLAAVAAAPEPEPLAVSTRLRSAGHDPVLVTAALTQIRLRRRAVTKFGPDADRMYFTVAGLEQATRAAVAARRADRFARSGAAALVDLGCGIGADLVAAARAGLRVTGVERDPCTAAVATANVAALGLSDLARVVCADATGFDLAGFDAAFCDPARRSDGRRVFDPDAYAPPWSFLLSVAARVPACAVKAAPGLDHDRVPDGAEAEWVSEGGGVVEAGLWFGPLASARHRATVLPAGASGRPAGEWPEAPSLEGSGRAVADVGPVRRYLYDPDGAVVRAHLVAELATALDASLVDPAIAYLSADALTATPFARAYEVEEVLPFSVKRLRAALAGRGVGRVEIKKRGSAVTPEVLRPQLRLAGPHAATVVLTRVAGAPAALLCQPVRGTS